MYYANIENIRTGTSTHMGGFRTLSELKTELWRRRTNKVIGGISDLYPKNQLPYDIVYQAHYELVTIIGDLNLLDALEED